MTTKDRILEMMRITGEMAAVLEGSAMPALAARHLLLEEAEAFIGISVRFLTGVDHLEHVVHEAQLDKDLDPAVIEAAAEFADRSRWLGTAVQTHAIVQVKRLGGNANRVLYDAEKRHS